MDVEHILRTLNDHGVEYIAVGGKEFLPNPAVSTSSDLAVLIHDSPANRTELNFALQDLGCHSSPGENVWKPVADDPQWLEEKTKYSLTCPHGMLEVFRAIEGTQEESFESCKSHASIRVMEDGEMYYCFSGEDVKKASFR